MAIADVTRLKDLRHKLGSYIWHAPDVLDIVAFSLYRNNCYADQKLTNIEKDLLGGTMSGSTPQCDATFSQSAGLRLRQLSSNGLTLRLNKRHERPETRLRVS